MRRLFLLLCLLASVCCGQLPPQSRIFTYSTLPSSPPTGISKTDLVNQSSNKTTYNLISGKWVVSDVQLYSKQGPVGPQGPQGVAGPQGPIGPQGPVGASGGSSASLPENFGRVWWVSNQAELDAATAATQTGGCSEINFTRDIGRSTTWELPHTPPNSSTTYPINFHGNSVIDTSISGLPVLVSRAPSDNGEANQMTSRAFVFMNGGFVGKNGSGTACDLGATYGSMFLNCNFTGFHNALMLRFDLMPTLLGCRSDNVLDSAFIITYGNWSGATNSNSQSNNALTAQCRVYAALGAKVDFGTYAASGCLSIGRIAEGENSNILYDFDSNGSTVVKDGESWNDHPEKPHADTTITAYRLRMTGGWYRVHGSFPQSNYRLIDAMSASGYPHLYVSDFTDVPTGSIFKTAGGVVWDFNEMGHEFDARLLSYWSGGGMPYYWKQTGYGLKATPTTNYEQFPFENFKSKFINYSDTYSVVKK